MACPAVTTAQGFLTQTLSHIDCQAQSIGSFGFQALSANGSPAASLLTAFLTLFIAIFGFRLLFGGDVLARDAVGGVLKVGIVLLLALSWPAYRILAYDTVLHGPAEIAALIAGPTLPDMHANAGGGLAERLQGIDDGIVALTGIGSGRLNGSLQVPGEAVQSFQGIALQDEWGYGWGRTIYLAATIGPLAALRIAAGLLLALGPLVAGLLLFELTRGLFLGWLRGLALTALGSLGISLLLGVQVAVMEPWLADALNRRTSGYATPGAPTELLALCLGFALASFGLLFILGRIAFQESWRALPWLHKDSELSNAQRGEAAVARANINTTPAAIHSRAQAIAQGVRTTMRHETLGQSAQTSRSMGGATSRVPTTGDRSSSSASGSREPLGNSWRRNARRTTAAHRRRDQSS